MSLLVASNILGPIFLGIAVHSHGGSLFDSITAAVVLFAMIPYQPPRAR